MAALSDANRREVWAEFMRALSRIRNGPGDLTKAELRAAVDATDQWIEDNAASFNSALPTRARGELSAKQKTQLLTAVAHKRYGVL